MAPKPASKAVIISSVLLVAFVLCWIASYTELRLHSSLRFGRAEVFLYRGLFEIRYDLDDKHPRFLSERGYIGVLGLGISFLYGAIGPYYIMDVPFWLLTLLTAVAPALKLKSMLYPKTFDAMAGTSLCSTCGYDLRASPDRCPECGTLRATESRKEMPRTSDEGGDGKKATGS